MLQHPVSLSHSGQEKKKNIWWELDSTNSSPVYCDMFNYEADICVFCLDQTWKGHSFGQNTLLLVIHGLLIY